jgi:fatty acid desaturase
MGQTCLGMHSLCSHRVCSGLGHKKIWQSSNQFKFMKKNMGNADRIIRVVLAALFAVLYFTKTVEGTFGLVLLVLGGVFLVTSVVSFCPLYKIVGLSTGPKE